jgi:hypothetical protein
MRLYNMAPGILLILSVIDFALAAPVQVQENPRAAVDVVRTPRDVIPVLGKRVVEEDLLEEAGTFFETSDKSVGSSDAHVSSGSAPPVPEHVDAQQPPPNPEPANPDHASGEPTSPSSTAPKPPSFDEKINQAWAAHYEGFIKNGPDRPVTPPESASYDDRITSAWDKHYEILSKEGSATPHAPTPNPELSTATPDHASVGPSSAASESAAPMPGSFDDKVDGMWAERYSKFLNNGPKKDNNFF